MAIEIRIATPADAEGVADVHVKAWQETYGYALPQEKLDAMDPADRVERWRSILNGDDGQQAYVAVNDADQIVGWATTGNCRDDDRKGGLELYAIYVLAAQHGTGIGQALLEVALGNRAASLWVMAGNERAIRFYERNGFVPDGVTKTDEIWGYTVNEIRMQRPAIVRADV